MFQSHCFSKYVNTYVLSYRLYSCIQCHYSHLSGCNFVSHVTVHKYIEQLSLEPLCFKIRYSYIYRTHLKFPIALIVVIGVHCPKTLDEVLLQLMLKSPRNFKIGGSLTWEGGVEGGHHLLILLFS